MSCVKEQVNCLSFRCCVTQIVISFCPVVSLISDCIKSYFLCHWLVKFSVQTQAVIVIHHLICLLPDASSRMTWFPGTWARAK